MADGVCAHLAGWEWRGGVALWIVCFLYLFVGISVVVNHFFVGAILLIVKRLRLSEDVAGATIMAAGSSFPVVCCSVISLARDTTQISIGVGNIVGAAVFNIVVVVGASCIALGRATQLDWRAVVRDAFFYLVAISALWGVLADGTVTWQESLALFLVYCAYVVFMALSRPVMGLWRQTRWGSNLSTQMILDACQKENRSHENFEPNVEPKGAAAPGAGAQGDLEEGKAAKPPPPKEPPEQQQQQQQQRSKHVVVVEALPPLPAKGGGRLSRARPSSPHDRIAPGSAAAAVDACLEGNGDELPFHVRSSHLLIHPLFSDGDVPSRANWRPASCKIEYPYGTVQFSPPHTWLGRLIWAVSLPWYAAGAATMPDARRRRGRRWYPLTFLVAMVWIAGLTYALVELSDRIVCLTGIPSSIWSSTALAAATSLPDLHASLPVARQGMGDMAVSNGVASNTFNILFALGLPYFIILLAAHTAVPVETADLTPNMVLLYLTVAVYVIPIAAMRWRTTPLLGILLFVLYVLFWVYSYVLVWAVHVWGPVVTL